MSPSLPHTYRLISQHMLMKRDSRWQGSFQGHLDHHVLSVSPAKVFPVFTVLPALLSAPSKLWDSSSPRTPLLRSCLIPAMFPTPHCQQPLAFNCTGLRLYVIMLSNVKASANNVNGTADGLSLCKADSSWSRGDIAEMRKKQPRKQLSIQRTLSPHLQSGKYIFLPGRNRTTQRECRSCIVWFNKIKALYHVVKENW